MAKGGKAKNLKIKLIALLCAFGLFFLLIVGAYIGVLIGILNNEAASSESEASDGSSLEAIKITGTYKNGKAVLNIKGETTEIKNLKGSGDKKSFTAKTKSKNSSGTELKLPSKTSAAKLVNGFVYQPSLRQENYTMSLWTGYTGYKLANNMISGKKVTKDAYGYARVNGDYIISLGTAYGKSKDLAKQRYRVTVGGKTFTAILGDIKSDKHTDGSHKYHRSDGSVVEFHTYGKTYKKNPNKLFPGRLTKLEKIGSQSVELKCTISKNKSGKTVVKFTGDVDGIPMAAAGTLEDGKIKASGYIGADAEAMVFASGGVDGMVKWAVAIANDDSHGYSQNNRQCSLCHNTKNKDYDCSSFVTAALAHSGVGGEKFTKACKGHAYTTSTLGSALKSVGYKNLGNLSKSKLKKGDILLNPSSHVEIYIGSGKQVGAHWHRGNTSAGDQDSTEVSVINYNHFYTQVWRKK